MHTCILRKYFNIEDSLKIYNWLTEYTTTDDVEISRIGENGIPMGKSAPGVFYYLHLAGMKKYKTCSTHGLCISLKNLDEAVLFKLTWG